jgi:hypothetical protein
MALLIDASHVASWTPCQLLCCQVDWFLALLMHWCSINISTRTPTAQTYLESALKSAGALRAAEHLPPLLSFASFTFPEAAELLLVWGR